MPTLEQMIKSIEDLKNWIIESEMENKLNKSDPFYPIYKNLIELQDKMLEDLSIDNEKLSDKLSKQIEADQS